MAINSLLQLFATVKWLFVAVGGALMGWFAGEAVQIVATNPPAWYETPTGAAALTAGFFTLIVGFLNNWWNARRDEKKREMHASDTSLNVSHQERQQLLNELKEHHQEEIKFLNRKLKESESKAERQIREAKVMEFEGRHRAHRYGNECNRLTGHIYRLNTILIDNKIEPPEWNFKTYPQIMEGLDEEIIAYKRQLEEEDREMKGE
jgi:hypothetical protein